MGALFALDVTTISLLRLTSLQRAPSFPRTTRNPPQSAAVSNNSFSWIGYSRPTTPPTTDINAAPPLSFHSNPQCAKACGRINTLSTPNISATSSSVPTHNDATRCNRRPNHSTIPGRPLLQPTSTQRAYPSHPTQQCASTCGRIKTLPTSNIITARSFLPRQNDATRYNRRSHHTTIHGRPLLQPTSS